MNAFDAARIDENLAPWQRLGKAGHFGRIDLESARFFSSRGKGIGAQNRFNHRVIEPQQAVIINRADPGEAGLDIAAGLVCRCIASAFESGVMQGFEQGNHRPRYIGRSFQSIDDCVDGEAHAGLAQIAIECAQPVCLRCAQPGTDNQPVERAVFGIARQHFGNSVFNRCRAFQHITRDSFAGHFQAEIVNFAQRAFFKPPVIKSCGYFGLHTEAEIFQRRHSVRQVQHAIKLADFQTQFVSLFMGCAEQSRIKLASAGRGGNAHPANVERCFSCAIAVAIGSGKGTGKARCESRGARPILAIA